jgi:hypothetical protein
MSFESITARPSVSSAAVFSASWRAVSIAMSTEGGGGGFGPMSVSKATSPRGSIG